MSQMQEIDLPTVQKLLNSNELELISTQKALCLPILRRIYKKMKLGIQFNGVKVKNSRIVDGHHRYICAQLAGVQIEYVEWEIAKGTTDHEWPKMSIVEEDYEDADQIKEHHKRDAEINGVNESIFKDL